MNNGKITVVHLITKLELGGAQLNTIYTAEHLDPLRYDVYLLSGAGGPLKSRLDELDRQVTVPALVREIHCGRDLQVLFSLLRFFKHIRPQIVHTHSSKAGIIGRLAAHLAGIPVIVHSVHGFSFSPFQSFFKRNFYLLAEKFCSRLTSHFIFVAQSDMNLACKINWSKGIIPLSAAVFPWKNSLAATIIRKF